MQLTQRSACAKIRLNKNNFLFAIFTYTCTLCCQLHHFFLNWHAGGKDQPYTCYKSIFPREQLRIPSKFKTSHIKILVGENNFDLNKTNFSHVEIFLLTKENFFLNMFKNFNSLSLPNHASCRRHTPSHYIHLTPVCLKKKPTLNIHEYLLCFTVEKTFGSCMGFEKNCYLILSAQLSQ